MKAVIMVKYHNLQLNYQPNIIYFYKHEIILTLIAMQSFICNMPQSTSELNYVLFLTQETITQLTVDYDSIIHMPKSMPNYNIKEERENA